MRTLMLYLAQALPHSPSADAKLLELKLENTYEWVVRQPVGLIEQVWQLFEAATTT